MDTYDAYARRRTRLLEQYAALPAGSRVRLAKRTSNLFRSRARTTEPGLDVHDFDGVLAIDRQRRTADVQGMTTYEHLVDATLAEGMAPLVVPQLKTITLGGAVTGLGIESTSFRNGCPHESVSEMEILTGDGRVVVARPDNEHRELFFGFPNSYGTLGYALRLTIELEPVQPYVRLLHLPYRDPRSYFRDLEEIATTRTHRGERVDFLDGTVFHPGALYLTLGTYADDAPYTSDYTGMDIYYRSIADRRRDYLTVRDYLWRWDTDWFWCSRAFGVQRPWLRRLWPKRWLRSDVYWRFVAFENRHGVKARLDHARGFPAREPVVQDVEIPVARAAEFLEFLHDDTGITPVWTCPLRQRDPARLWDLYSLDPSVTYVNFGFWSSVPLREGEPGDLHNRRIERKVDELGGRKSLYSTSFYDEDEFERLYGGQAYEALKKTYDGDTRLLDLYTKCVRRG